VRATGRANNAAAFGNRFMKSTLESRMKRQYPRMLIDDELLVNA